MTNAITEQSEQSVITNCVICGKELTEWQIKRGTSTCCRSCSGIKRYQNPEHRKQTGEAVKKVWQNEDFRKKMSIAIKATWAEHYDTRIESIRIGRNRPEVKEQQNKRYREYKNSEKGKKEYSERMKQIWADKEKSKNLRIALEKMKKDLLILRKQIETKKRNGTFGKSRQADDCISYLKRLGFTIEQEKEYPNQPLCHCDVYIKELDLWIELHFGWQHQYCAFDKKDSSMQEHLNWLKEKAKTSNYYNNVIYQWTDLDVRKKQYAEASGINWIAFYTIQDFYDYINDKGETDA